MEIILSIAGTIITIISFVYAVYENRRHSKLVHYNRDQAWEIQRQTCRVLSLIQEIEKSEQQNTQIINSS